MIRRLLVFLTVNLSVTNMLVKQIHDCESVGVSVAGTIVLLLPKEMWSGTAVEVCIKENKTDCVWLAVLDMNETEGDRRAIDAWHSETTRNHWWRLLENSKRPLCDRQRRWRVSKLRPSEGRLFLEWIDRWMSMGACNWNIEGELDCHREDEESQLPERLRNLNITYSDVEWVEKRLEKLKSHDDDHA